MIFILEPVFKGLVQWLYGLVLQCVEFLVNSLLDVFTMDMAYFEKNVPVIKDFQTILLAMGWVNTVNESK